MEPTRRALESADKTVLKQALEYLMSQEQPIFLLTWVDGNDQLAATMGGNVMDVIQMYPRLGAAVSVMLDEAQNAKAN